MMNFSEIMGNNLFLISFFQILFYFAELFWTVNFLCLKSKEKNKLEK